ncbi:MAG: FG-GAP-like repeat-containing protein, partial [Jatrophihabitantaceae bacterium]
FDKITAGDVDGAGLDDLVATKPDGSMWLFRNTGSTAQPFAGGVNIGSGWQAYDRVMMDPGPAGAPDRPADVIATKPDGSLWLFRNTGSTAHPFGSPVPIGTSVGDGYDLLATGDVDGDGNADLLARKPDGSLWLYPSAGTQLLDPAALIGGSGWQGFDKVAAGDVDGDGRTDLLATKPDGTLWYYRNSGTAGHPYSSGVKIGASGWQGFDKIAAGDVTGDGRADILATTPSGQLWLYVSNGSTTVPYTTGVLIGTSGWNAFNRLAVGDVNGDGLGDIVATKPDGTMWLYRNVHNPSAPFPTAIQIGTGWQQMSQLAVADVDRDGRADLLATSPDGTLWFYANTGTPTAPFSGRVPVGSGGWQAYDRLVI